MPFCGNCNSYVEENIQKCPFCGFNISIDQKQSKIIKSQEENSPQPILQKQTKFKDKNDNELIFHSPEIEEMDLTFTKKNLMTKELEPISQRRYFHWFLLGIVSFGIFFLIYLFLNLDDLEKHSHYPLDSKANEINVNSTQVLILFIVALGCGFIPILWWIYYKKYNSLYTHLKKQNFETAPLKIPHTIFYMIPLILSHLIALVPTITNYAIGFDLKLNNPMIFWAIIAVIILLSLMIVVFDYLWQRAFNVHLKFS